MQLRKSLSIFLSLCMMLSIMSTPVTVSATSADTWQSLQTAINAGGTVTLDDDVTALASDAALTVPADMTVTLNLNGHTIDRALSSPADSGSVIIANTAASGADLGLKSGVPSISFSVAINENITNGSVSSDKNTAESGETIILTATPERGMVLNSITVTCGGKNVTLTDLGGGEYSFLMPDGNVAVTAEFGENEIFTINSAEEWEAFSRYIANGEYTDEDWKLGADISVNVSVTTTDYASGATVGTETHPFSGTFDGQGHTLTVNIADTYYYFDGNVQYYNQGAAPFRYISGATIENLTVEGTIYGGYHTAGLVGFNQGGESTIENCAVNVTFSASDNIYQYIGGVLGHNKSAKITMKDVVFGGTINNSEYGGAYRGNMVGGLIGWSDSSTVVLDNCLFKGSITGEIYRFNPVLLKNGSSTVSANLSDVYYTCEPHTVWLRQQRAECNKRKCQQTRIFGDSRKHAL